MRKLIAAAFVSLDGVMQAPGGPEEDPSNGFAHGGWTAPFWAEDTNPFMGVFEQTSQHPFDLLLGRRTYDIFAAYWPVHQDIPIGPLFNRVTKYVATSRPDRLDWVSSVGLSGAVPDAVAELKKGDGPDLLTQGSSVLGQGKRWFGDSSPPVGFVLEQCVTFSTGVISTVYRRAGEVRTGTVGDA